MRDVLRHTLFRFQMPPVGEPEDPRTQKTVLGMAGSSMELAIPRFKVRLAPLPSHMHPTCIALCVNTPIQAELLPIV